VVKNLCLVLFQAFQFPKYGFNYFAAAQRERFGFQRFLCNKNKKLCTNLFCSLPVSKDSLKVFTRPFCDLQPHDERPVIRRFVAEFGVGRPAVVRVESENVTNESANRIIPIPALRAWKKNRKIGDTILHRAAVEEGVK
jgi:hypothetical protein